MSKILGCLAFALALVGSSRLAIDVALSQPFTATVYAAEPVVKTTAPKAVPVLLQVLPGHHVTINGPTEVPVGGLCIVTVEGLKAEDSLSWVAVPAIPIADLLDRQGRPVLLVPSNTVGTYHLVLAFVDDGKVAQRTHTVTVGTPVPPGPTPPGPTPPGPTPPAPTDPLAKQMLQWLAPVKAQLTAKIVSDLGSVYESVAAEAVATQGTMTKDGFVAATQTQAVRILGPTVALAMRDPFFIPLAKYMNAKGLAANDEAGHADLWREVAAALAEVAKSW